MISLESVHSGYFHNISLDRAIPGRRPGPGPVKSPKFFASGQGRPGPTRKCAGPGPGRRFKIYFFAYIVYCEFAAVSENVLLFSCCSIFVIKDFLGKGFLRI